MKIYDGQIKWMYFWLKIMTYLKNIIPLGNVDIKKIASESIYNKEYLKTKIKSHGNEVTDFYDKKFIR